MERRKAFAAAGAVSATAIVGVLALGANVGLFGLTSRSDGPGKFKIVDAAQIVPDTSSSGTGSPGAGASSDAGGSLSAGTSTSTTHATTGSSSVRTTTSTAPEHESEPEREEDD